MNGLVDWWKEKLLNVGKNFGEKAERHNLNNKIN
jgi:hypothetical protein